MEENFSKETDLGGNKYKCQNETFNRSNKWYKGEHRHSTQPNQQKNRKDEWTPQFMKYCVQTLTRKNKERA